MKQHEKPAKALNIILWGAQILLSLCLIWASWMKWFTPAEELAGMWPWTGDVSSGFVKFTGIIDLAGGLGLILPPLLKMNRKLVPLAAIGIIVLMICAGIFHISRGEADTITPNLIFALIAAFIAWGRSKNQ